MVRILVYPANPDGRDRCGHRLIWPAEVLQAQGADIGIVRGREDPVWEGGADVVVIQRPMLRRYVEGISDVETTGAIQRLQADGIRVVVDIDDDFMALNRKNSVWRNVHPSLSPDCNWQHLSTACRLADLVTVTTPALARRYGGHGRVAIIPNHIPESYLTIGRPDNDVPVVGWTGAVATHPDDLQVTRGGVSRAVNGTGAQFRMVGPSDGVQANLGLSEPPVATGFVSLDDYPYEMAKIDVGIVPLEMTAFNQAKSYLKGLEFAALGIPYVFSPTDPYLVVPGGVVAGKPKDWERHVSRLVVDEGLRASVAERGRRWAETQTVELNAHLWAEVWERAFARSRRKVTA